MSCRSMTPLFALIVCLSPAVALAQKSPAIIRTPDDRMDYYQVTPALQAVGNAICAMIPRTSMTANADGSFTVNPQTLAEQRAPWCPDEPFGNQPAAADCSCSLVGSNIIITAGHCFENDAMMVRPLNTWYFVFDYFLRDANTMPSNFSADQVYSAAEILGRVNVENSANDWAVIRLDRAVTGRTPLGFRQQGTAAVGQQVMTIGFGAGIPMKFSGNATIQQMIDFGFEADLDIIEGNSGGCVIDVNTRTIEGVISNDLAVNDFFMDAANNCNRATRCPADNICQTGFSQICAVTVADFQNAINNALNNNGMTMPMGGGCFGGMMMLQATLIGMGLMKWRRVRRRN